MKRLKFKTEFNGVGNALNLIPENHRFDNNVFEMTDGNESYKIKWEGTLSEGRAVVLTAQDKKMVNEDLQKMKRLMNYKSADSLGVAKGSERIDENAKFKDILNKTKAIISEDINEISSDMFNRAVDKSKSDGTDNRTRELGSNFTHKFKGQPLFGGVIENITMESPKSGRFKMLMIMVKIESEDGPKTNYVYYDLDNDQYDLNLEIDKKDARMLSLIAQKVNPETKYKNGGDLKIKGRY